MKWFYADKGESLGPYSADDLKILLQSGEIGPDTLVWRQGRDWGPLRDQRELADLVAARPKPTPPSIPLSSPPKPSSRQRRTDAVAAAADRPKPASRWRRLQARLIDIALLGGLIGGSALLMSVLKQALYPFGIILTNLAIIATFVAAIALYLVLIGVMGNTVGKAVAGIQAVPLDGRKRMRFGELIAREISVYSRGLLLFIPVLSLITAWLEWQAVSGGESASYDIGRAQVVKSPNARWQVVVIILITAIVGAAAHSATFNIRPAKFGGSFTPRPEPVTIEPEAVPEPELAIEWTNPQTGTTVTIPPGWAPTADTDSVVFINATDETFAQFKCTTMPEGMNSLADYRAMIEKALPHLGTFSAFVTAPGSPRLIASGELINSPNKALVVIGPGGQQFCQLTYVDMLNTRWRYLDDEAMTAALFESAGG